MVWWRFVFVLLGTPIVLHLGLWALILVVDPYGAGRFTWLAPRPIPMMDQSFAAQNLATSPGFDSAIIGNSIIELVNPARLDNALQSRFVQLSVPGSTPREQMVILDWFRRSHVPPIKYLLLEMDDTWCGGDPDPHMRPPAVFPFWLYGGSDRTYLEAFLFAQPIDPALRRLKLLFGRGAAYPPDGFVDYEIGRSFDLSATRKRLAEHKGLRKPDAPSEVEATEPIGFAWLRQALAGLAPSTRLILVLPPVHAVHLPPAGSERARFAEACRLAMRGIAESVPNTVLVDLWRDIPEAHDDSLWWDETHMRGAVARLIEDEVAAAVGAGAMTPQGRSP